MKNRAKKHLNALFIYKLDCAVVQILDLKIIVFFDFKTLMIRPCYCTSAENIKRLSDENIHKTFALQKVMKLLKENSI